MLMNLNTSTPRVQRHRRRKREGKWVLTVEMDMNIHDVAETLIEHGLLDCDTEDRAAISEACGRLLIDVLEDR
jgi:hypothetical protein